MNDQVATCAICGEPMPEAEQMFKYHGYSGPCPKPPLSRETLMETMIQPKVIGYRQLSETEVALMNEGKALAEQCGAYIDKLRQHNGNNTLLPVLDQRWISIGATDLQRGFMAVIRGIAQPTTF